LTVILIGLGGEVDTRNVLDVDQVRAAGFSYSCTGRELAGRHALAAV
jgi:hypothetical protein